jgi:3-hydroxy acid dehydrogenase/malonic semialdehyde reductase
MPQIICITGATSGIGQATARLFAKKGWKAVVTGRRSGRLAQLEAEFPGQICPLVFDIRDKNAVATAFAAIPEEFSEIDVLMNNAGLARGLDPAQTSSLSEWEEMTATNINGLLYVTRALLPAMVARSKGHIINISSIASECAYPGANVYGASKAFVTQFSRNLRADLLGTAVRVTDIAPGMLESEFSILRFRGDLARAAAVYENTQPLVPDDIADCVWFAVNMPTHVNINRMEVMPLCQSHGPATVHKNK